ncbi:hypothetical protein PpBr36_03095, partial [Pyricularia pennisetigena]|uniref:hypothetical protein n=1 Tax=Pyricularia pennisetigena TaxID=1578925 RepID=UPI00114E6735
TKGKSLCQFLFNTRHHHAALWSTPAPASVGRIQRYLLTGYYSIPGNGKMRGRAAAGWRGALTILPTSDRDHTFLPFPWLLRSSPAKVRLTSVLGDKGLGEASGLAAIVNLTRINAA